ncbi:hypothetical protein ACF0H5_017073 [Mactra antiquata]
MNSQLLIGIGILGFALLLDIISTAIPYWWVMSLGDAVSSSIGLFQICDHAEGLTACVTMTVETDWWRAVQALMILSILALGAAVGLALLFCFVMKDKGQFGLFSAVLGAAGAGFAVLGVIIFAAKASDYSKASDYYPIGGLHAGFGLAIVSAIFAIVGSVMIVISRNANN